MGAMRAPSAPVGGAGVPKATIPPPLPGRSTVPPVQRASAPPALYVVFNGQKVPVDKDQFIIGRGSKSSDLPIRDGNISRKHAAVILHQGAYYMKDLGSTNGVAFRGRRIDQKRIEEGDIFHICDYELRFTYQ